MLKIGDFSRLSLVSVKALRYYDELGLLSPSEVDRFTGYRYYTFDQLVRLNRILALKDLGFSLEQIKPMLAEKLTPDQLRGMLRLRQAEAQQQVEAEQTRLARIDARLRQIEQETTMSAYDVVIKKIEPQTVASVRQVIPAPQAIGQLIQALFAGLGQLGVRPAGPLSAIWHDTDYHEKDVDTEVVVPIAGAFPESRGLKAVQLPGVERMACAIHQGSYEGFSQAYASIMQWIETNGYRLAGPTREIYLRGPDSGGDPSTYVTEIQIPVEKA